MGLPVNKTVTTESPVTEFSTIDTSIINKEKPAFDSTTLKAIVSGEEKPVTKPSTLVRDGSCSEGWKHGENGICEKIKVSETTEMNVISTTDRNRNDTGAINLLGCPKGMKKDAQGSCQYIERSNATKPIIDPKVLLNPDGSCPDKYAKDGKQCLYVGETKNPTLYPTGLGNNKGANGMARRRNGNVESTKVEAVPENSDRTCQPGSEHGERGLCRQTNRSAIPVVVCPDHYELKNNKCVYKKSKIPNQSESTTPITKIGTPESTTLTGKPIRNDELTTISTPIKSSTEFHTVA